MFRPWSLGLGCLITLCACASGTNDRETEDANEGRAGSAGSGEVSEPLPGTRDDADIVADDFASSRPKPAGADVPEDFSLLLEAEDATLGGQSERLEAEDASGGAYVGLFDGWDPTAGETQSSIAWEVEVPAKGVYSLIVTGAVDEGNGRKENGVVVNGAYAGAFETVESATWYEHAPLGIYLEAGANTIEIEAGWGWTNIDAIEIVALDSGYLDVEPTPVTPEPSDPARRLLHYLARQYGKKTLSGQQGTLWVDSVFEMTGKYPAILGVDYIDFSSSRVAEQGAPAYPGPTREALEWWEDYGGIVTAMWHWNAPSGLVDDRAWVQGFYTENTTFDLTAALSDESSEDYQLLIEDLDIVAEELKKLDEAGVPILWRPLHEASGGWFWWGAAGAESYLGLWNLMFERFTDHHGLKNLIWVWNGQSPEFYPGDATVDVVSEDIYAPGLECSPQLGAFLAATEYAGVPKIVALSENGTLLDPELQRQTGAAWSWFCVWSGADFVTDETQNELSMFRTVYESDWVVTLDELPLIKNYPLPGQEP